MIEPRYPYVAVDVPEELAEEAGAQLFELGAGGVEQRDATTLTRGAAGRVTLVASFEAIAEAQAALAEMPPEWSPRLEEVVGDAWRDEWKRHFEPFHLCGPVVVCPPWRAYEPAAAAGEVVLVLEPGRAFGTGLHETTSLVAEVLAGEDLRGKRVLDVGCGSGILAHAAVKLGAASARAVDVDPDAVLVTRENAERNGLRAEVVVDGTPVHELAERYDVVVANIESKALVEIATALVERVAPGGVLVLSGVLSTGVAPAQLADIRTAYGSLREERVLTRGEWIAVVLREPRSAPER